MVENSGDAPLPAVDWRLKLGGALFVLSVAAPLVVLPLVASMGLSGATTGAVSAAALAGAEVLGIAAVAVLGKSGYAYLKARVAGFLRQHSPPRQVSRARYRLSLILFVLPILFGWASPYLASALPALPPPGLAVALTGDAILLTGLFVLGGDFWDKVRALFVHDARATFS